MANPYVEIQLSGADGNTWRNQVDVGNAQFLRYNSVSIKRNALRAAKELVINIDNRGGTYNSIITKGTPIQMWIGATLDGSDKVSRFKGLCYKIEKSKRNNSICNLKATFKDATYNLMNTLVAPVTIVPGATLTSGGLSGYAASYTFTDYAEIIKYILSFKRHNPEVVSIASVQSSGSVPTQNKNYTNTPVLDAIFNIAQECNFNFYIDTSNVAHFEPKTTAPTSSSGIRTLSETTDFGQINELFDTTAEKNNIMMFCGETTDGNRIFSPYRAPDIQNQVKTIFRRDINIAPNVAGGDAATRSSNARKLCAIAARNEYEKLKAKHEYRVEVFTYRDTEVGDFYALSSTDIGITAATTLKLTDIEEVFSPMETYRASYILSTNLT